MSPTLRILAIDDSQTILSHIQNTLQQAKHQCQIALGPNQAQRFLPDGKFDLILLDVEMPEINGIQLCREIRKLADYATLPIIFVSADNREESVLEGFAAGGTDYIYKPFQDRELIARVEAHGYRARIERELQQKTQELADLSRRQEEEIRQRTLDLATSEALAMDTLSQLSQTMSAQEELVRVRKLESLGMLVADLAHEINTPLGNSLTLATFLKFLQNSLGKGGEINPDTIPSYLKESEPCLEMLINNLNRITELIQRFRSVVSDNIADSWGKFDLEAVISDCLARLQPKLGDTQVELAVRNPEKLITSGYPATLGLIMDNLIRNSAEHGFEPAPFAGASLTIEANIDNETIAINFHDNGRGVDPEIIDKICEPFFTTKRYKGNTGLGLFIVQNQVRGRLHGIFELDRTSANGFGCTIRFPRNLSKPA